MKQKEVAHSLDVAHVLVPGTTVGHSTLSYACPPDETPQYLQQQYLQQQSFCHVSFSQYHDEEGFRQQRASIFPNKDPSVTIWASRIVTELLVLPKRFHFLPAMQFSSRSGVTGSRNHLVSPCGRLKERKGVTFTRSNGAGFLPIVSWHPSQHLTFDPSTGGAYCDR